MRTIFGSTTTVLVALTVAGLGMATPWRASAATAPSPAWTGSPLLQSYDQIALFVPTAVHAATSGSPTLTGYGVNNYLKPQANGTLLANGSAADFFTVEVLSNSPSLGEAGTLQWVLLRASNGNYVCNPTGWVGATCNRTNAAAVLVWTAWGEMRLQLSTQASLNTASLCHFQKEQPNFYDDGNYPAGWMCNGSNTGGQGVVIQRVLAPVFTLAVGANGGVVTSTDGKINTGTGASAASYSMGTATTLTAASAADYHFLGWSGAGGACPGTTPTCVVPPLMSAANIAATFSNQWPVTVNIKSMGTPAVMGGLNVGGGYCNANQCTINVTNGSVSVRNGSGPAYFMVSLSSTAPGPCTTSSCTLTVTGPATVTATFQSATKCTGACAM